MKKVLKSSLALAAVAFVAVVIALNVIAYYTTPADSVEATDTTSVSEQAAETTAPEA